MTFEERIERLTERHEALAQSVEMLLIATRENTENIARNTGNIAKLVQVTNHDAENIRALVRIAEARELRLNRLDPDR